MAGGKRITINELANITTELMGKNIQVEHIKERAGDVKHSLADISKATELIDFTPKYPLDNGLEETIRYRK